MPNAYEYQGEQEYKRLVVADNDKEAASLIKKATKNNKKKPKTFSYIGPVDMIQKVEEIKESVKSMIGKIEADERFHYPAADVFSNAPLALVQQDLESRMAALKQVMELLK